MRMLSLRMVTAFLFLLYLGCGAAETPPGGFCDPVNKPFLLFGTKDCPVNLKIRGFWSVYNHIPEPQKLNVRNSYHLMRMERRPVWEDEENSEGGNWTLKCKTQDTETVWKHLLLAAIGEQFSDCMAEDDEVIGVSVSIRDRDNLILIWNKKAVVKEKSTIIEKVMTLLPDITFTTVFYKAFDMHMAFEGRKGHRMPPR